MCPFFLDLGHHDIVRDRRLPYSNHCCICVFPGLPYDMASPQVYTPPPERPSLSFTHGLLIGQLSVVLLIGAFIKFFIFGEAPAPTSRAAGYYGSSSRHGRQLSLHGLNPKESPPNSLRHKKSTNNILRAVPSNSTNTASILRKTYYQISPQKSSGKDARNQSHHSSHQPESLDWFNVLIAQTIAQYRQAVYNMKDPTPDGPSILSTLTDAINDPEKKPSFIDKIAITEVSLGEEFPIFSNCRVIALEDDGPGGVGRLQALMDVDLSDDNLTLGIETSLILNYPKPFSAILPVALSVSVVRFSGTLSISFVPATPTNASSGTAKPDTTGSSSNNSGAPKTNLAFSFLPDYRLDLSVRSLVGSRSRLQDVPKIAQLVEAQVQAWFEDRVVEPRVQIVPLPGLWPRMSKTNVRANEDGRPVSQEGSKADTPRVRREELPTREEMEGLRRRGGVNARDFPSDEDFRMPGAMPFQHSYS